jgi:hypothetical protein
MTQKIFYANGKEDKDLLWSILPDSTQKIVRGNRQTLLFNSDGECFATIESFVLKINWQDKREITRPIQEATEQDIGKLCYFWDNNTSNGTYCILVEVQSGMYKSKRKGYYEHARRLTKQEIEELC